MHFYIASAREGSLGKLHTGPLTIMICDIYSTRSLATTRLVVHVGVPAVLIDGLQLGSSELPQP